MPEQEEQAAAANAAPSFIDPLKRLKVFPLAYPVAYAGKEYDVVVVRRLTVGEVESFLDRLRQLREGDPNAALRWPMCVDRSGEPLPEAVLDGLDDDDASLIEKAIADFLPRRFRASQTA